MNKGNTLLVVLLFSATLLANDSFYQVDSDNSGKISKKEFDVHISSTTRFADWDENADGLLASAEFERVGLTADLEKWDINADGKVDFIEYHKGAFSYLDEDGDYQLDDSEWLDVGKSYLLD